MEKLSDNTKSANTYRLARSSYQKIGEKAIGAMEISLSAGAAEVISTICGAQTADGRDGEAYLVGGAVRDALLGLPAKDEDIATNLSPTEVTELFEMQGDVVLPTGINYGTVTVFPDGDMKQEGYEVTVFRTDASYEDGRHPNGYAIAKSIEDDLARRDFTINAMAYSDQRGLVDPFGGAEDLKKPTAESRG